MRKTLLGTLSGTGCRVWMARNLQFLRGEKKEISTYHLENTKPIQAMSQTADKHTPWTKVDWGFLASILSEVRNENHVYWPRLPHTVIQDVYCARALDQHQAHSLFFKPLTCHGTVHSRGGCFYKLHKGALWAGDSVVTDHVCEALPRILCTSR